MNLLLLMGLDAVQTFIALFMIPELVELNPLLDSLIFAVLFKTIIIYIALKNLEKEHPNKDVEKLRTTTILTLTIVYSIVVIWNGLNFLLWGIFQ